MDILYLKKGFALLALATTSVIGGGDKSTAEAVETAAPAAIVRPAADAPGSFVVTDYITGLNQCITIAFAPDGRLFLLEKEGKVWVLDGGMLQPWAELRVDSYGERGLLGIAFDPDFNENGFVYLFYSIRGSTDNKVVRLKEVEGRGTDETLVLRIEDYIDASNHNGGDINFGPDKMLYITTGDGGGPPGRSQQGTNLSGKILRVNPHGSLPIRFKSPEDIFYARGLRNSFRMAWNPYNDTLYATENGPRGRDEINRITKGGDYGWPREKGFSPRNRFANPLWDFGPKSVAPTGIAFYPWWGKFPKPYHGNLFITDYNYGRVYRIKLSGKALNKIRPEDMKIWMEEDFAGTTFADIKLGPDGALYLAGFSKIVRIEYVETIE